MWSTWLLLVGVVAEVLLVVEAAALVACLLGSLE
jgi:hypothetical protein